MSTMASQGNLDAATGLMANLYFKFPRAMGKESTLRDEKLYLSPTPSIKDQYTGEDELQSLP